ASVELELSPGGVLAGEVYSDAGEPLSGAKVRLLKTEEGNERAMWAQRAFGGSFKRSVAKDDGSFEFTGLPEGKYAIFVKHEGYSRAEVMDLAPGDQIPRIVLQQATQLKVVVRDGSSGQPVSSFRISLSEEGEKPSRWNGSIRQVSNSAGVFEREDLEPKRYDVLIEAGGYLVQKQTVELMAGEPAELPFDLEVAGRIGGRIVDVLSRKPLAGVEVALLRGGTGDESEAGFEKASGPDSTADAREESSEAVDSGEPKKAYFEERQLGRASVTDRDGYFLMDSVPDGVQTVVVTHPDFVQEYTPDVAIVLGEQQTLDFALRRGLSLKGVVIDSDGRPARGAVVFLSSNDAGREALSKTKGSDPKGRFEFSGLEEGNYRVVARLGDGVKQSIDVRVDADSPDVRLEFED
ncbi:MAG: carboxypeptidase-like regulatory domain-containing protein, partial [Planctomycetota bacterium]